MQTSKYKHFIKNIQFIQKSEFATCLRQGIKNVGIVTSILSLAARMVFVARVVSMETDSINDFVEAYVFALVIPMIYAVVGHNNTASKHIITLILRLIFDGDRFGVWPRVRSALMR